MYLNITGGIYCAPSAQTFVQRTNHIEADASHDLPDFVSAFARGLTAIRAFGPDADELTISEVATRSGLTRANARRLLLTLVQLGYAEAVDRRFRLTARILDLGYAYLSSLSFAGIAQPIIERLADDVGERCNVAVLDGRDIVFVMRASTKAHSTSFPMVTIGSRFRAHAQAMGRVLLGGLPEADLDHFLVSETFEKLTPRTLTDVQQLRKAIDTERTRGWSFVRHEQNEATCTLGAPIHNAAGTIVAAIGIGWFSESARSDKAKAEHAVPLLLAATRSINVAFKHGGYDIRGPLLVRA